MNHTDHVTPAQIADLLRGRPSPLAPREEREKWIACKEAMLEEIEAGRTSK